MREFRSVRLLILLALISWSPPVSAQGELEREDRAALERARMLLAKAISRKPETQGYHVEIADEPLDLLEGDRLVLFGSYMNLGATHFEISRGNGMGRVRRITALGIEDFEVSTETLDQTLRTFLYLAQASVTDAESRRIPRAGPTFRQWPRWQAEIHAASRSRLRQGSSVRCARFRCNSTSPATQRSSPFSGFSGSWSKGSRGGQHRLRLRVRRRKRAGCSGFSGQTRRQRAAAQQISFLRILSSMRSPPI